MNSELPPGQPPLTPKHAEARKALPENLQPIFEDLVADYRWLAAVHHRAPFVSYVVLADLVRNGWRRSGEQTDTPMAQSSPSMERKVADQ
jgi:hypothetical protein